MDRAVDQELVAQDSIQIEEVEDQLAALGIINLVGEGQGNIKLREAGQMEPGIFITGITASTPNLAEQCMESEQALISVLGGEIHAVIVIPERAHCLVDVAGGRERRRAESRPHLGIILVAEMTSRVEVAGVPITF